MAATAPAVAVRAGSSELGKQWLRCWLLQMSLPAVGAPSCEEYCHAVCTASLESSGMLHEAVQQPAEGHRKAVWRRRGRSAPWAAQLPDGRQKLAGRHVALICCWRQGKIDCLTRGMNEDQTKKCSEGAWMKGRG